MMKPYVMLMKLIFNIFCKDNCLFKTCLKLIQFNYHIDFCDGLKFMSGNIRY